MKRRVIVQGAVLATLTSRPAWTQDVCNAVVSANAFASIAAGASLNPAERDMKDLLDRWDIEAVELDNGDICIREKGKPEVFAPRNKYLRQRDFFKEDK